MAVAPAQAQLFVDGKQVDGHRIERPADDGEIDIEVKLDGYRSELHRVPADSDQVLAIALQPLESGSNRTELQPSSKDHEPRSKARRRRGQGKRTSRPSASDSAPTRRDNGRFVQDSPYDED